MAHPPALRRTGAFALIASLALLAGLLTAVPALGETDTLPVTVTTSSRNGLVDGSTVSIHVDATGSAIYGAEARLCAVDADITYSADFNPSQTGKCINAPLSGGSDAHTSVANDPTHYGSADLDFRVGVGTNSYTTGFGDNVSIQCGPGHPCKLTVKLQVPGATGFRSFPLSFAGDAPLPDLYHPLTPARILDSRPAPYNVGPYTTKWGAGTTRSVTVAGLGGVPADADAVVLNVAVTGTTAASYLKVWPAGLPTPTSSSLNWAAGQTIPNAVTVKVGAGGAVSVRNATGQANVIVDVVGYFSPDSGSGYTAVAPARILDSRPAPYNVGPYTTKWGAGTTRSVTVAGVGGVPADAEAVVLHVAVTGTTTASYLKVWPAGLPTPTSSSLNWAAGQTIANAVTVKVGAGGAVSVRNATGQANVIVDVVGYYKVGTGDPFHPVSPARILDSRPAPYNVGPYTTKWGAGTTRSVSLTSVGGIPSGAHAVLLNVVVTGTTTSSYLTIWPAGTPVTSASSLSWTAGVTIAGSVTALPNASGQVSVRNKTGQTNVIADVAGWYGP